jgi:hypothetical protein
MPSSRIGAGCSVWGRNMIEVAAVLHVIATSVAMLMLLSEH